MRATDFEYRHQTLLHLLVVGLAFLTYVIKPDDVVWALLKNHTAYRALLERLVFGTGTLMVVGSAVLQTWANAYRGLGAANVSPLLACDDRYRCIQYPLYLGRILFALGLGQLAPALGTVILLAGEMVLVLRLLCRDRVTIESSPQYREHAAPSLRMYHLQLTAGTDGANWGRALRKEASKWGLAVTMIVFTVTLRDRVAEILAGASFLVWIGLNIPDFARSTGSVHQR
jgi:hypothetical protein